VTGRRKRHRRAPFALAVLALALGVLIYFESRPTVIELPGNAAAGPDRQAGAPGPNPAGFAMPPLRSFAQVLERPLFSPTRRPALDALAASDTQSSGLTLVGIVISPTEHHALIEHGQPPRLERVVEGQQLEGWTVEAILPDAVTFRRADQSLELKAKDAPPPPQAPQRRPP
jgi:general secretion pathway protein N